MLTESDSDQKGREQVEKGSGTEMESEVLPGGGRRKIEDSSRIWNGGVVDEC